MYHRRYSMEIIEIQGWLDDKKIEYVMYSQVNGYEVHFYIPAYRLAIDYVKEYYTRDNRLKEVKKYYELSIKGTAMLVIEQYPVDLTPYESMMELRELLDKSFEQDWRTRLQLQKLLDEPSWTKNWN